MTKKSSSVGAVKPIPIIVIDIVVLFVVIAIASGSLNFNASISRDGKLPASKSSLSETNTFSQSGITLEYPGDWSQSQTPSGFIASFSSPKEDSSDTFSENLNIKSIDLSPQPEITLQQTADLWLNQTKADFPSGDFNLLSKTPTTLAGLPAQQIVYMVKDADLNGKGMTVITIQNNTAYIISFTAESASAYDKFEVAVNSILSSFELD